MTTIIAASVICLGTMGFLDQLPLSPAQEEQLSSKIQAANHEKFKSVRDAKDWNNPYLVVRADGIEVISKAIPSGRKLVAPTELRRILSSLPTSAWPYGRVVAMQENGVRAPGDDKPIGRNKQVAEAALKALRLEISWWPSE
jgi:hypothetical protein